MSQGSFCGVEVAALSARSGDLESGVLELGDGSLGDLAGPRDGQLFERLAAGKLEGGCQLAETGLGG
ncbi:MAG: hypothetical protein ACRDUY_09075 [Nitriliruptorales bacterium]